jgi:primosomal protein N' (replication factor Y)
MPPLFAEIAIHAAVPTTFHYSVPEFLADSIRVGHLVDVGFKTGRQPGIVMALADSSPIATLKPVRALMHPDPVLSPQAVRLARRLADEYLVPVGLCVWLWLPPNLAQHTQPRYRLLDSSYRAADALELELLSLFSRRGALREAQIRTAIQHNHWPPVAERLEAEGVIRVESVLTPPVPRPPKVQLAQLAFHPAALDDALVGLARVASKAKRADVWAHVLRVLSREEEPVDVSWVYAQTGAKLPDLQKLADFDLILLGEKKTWRDELAERDYIPAAAPMLTTDQASAWSHLESALARGKYAGFLLHGVTGSGKTELYLKAMASALAQGRQVLYLVPEIALTAQTLRRVRARFPGQAAVIHSRLSEAERYRVWGQARDGAVPIVIGPRSALFAPLPDPGLIIIDEEHDGSYRNMSAPLYDTRRLAEWMAQAHDAVLILGSATPDVETMERAKRRELTLLELPARLHNHRLRAESQAARAHLLPEYDDAQRDAVARGLPPVTLVDMRAELRDGNATLFSRALHSALDETLARGEQAVLLLNRRGTSTYVFCRDCGYVARCPNDQQPLTYHEHDSNLRCHLCGHHSPAPMRCPSCSSDRIRYFGAGTQQVEAEVMRRFPSARVLRWDSDALHRPEVADAILARFWEGRADVLVGTQMVTKGLDLPGVTLVGVVSADVALHLPDFRAAERAFQLITQAVGRAGRGLRAGRAVVQSHAPEHYAIAHACRHDYDGFAAQELAYRQRLGYPPYRRLARVVFKDRNAARARSLAEQGARALAARIAELGLTGTDIIGPAPCYYARIGEVFRWQILVRAPDPRLALRDAATANGWHVELDPDDVL